MSTIPAWVEIGGVLPAGAANSQADIKKLHATVIAGEAPIPVIYGKAQVGGQVFAATFTGGYWYLGVLFCMGEVEAVDNVYLNGAAAVSGVTINTYTGTTGQTADALLAAAISGYTDTLVISDPAGNIGVCYAVIKYTNDHYAGLPDVIGNIRGRKVYNPSTTLTVYSENPALALRDIITNATFGLGEGINDTRVNTLVTACDALVITQARRTIGLALVGAKEPQKWVDILAMYAGAWAFKRGDEWQLIADRPATSVATFTDANIVADSFKINIADSAQAPTVVEVTYTDTTATPVRVRSATAELAGVSAGTTPRRVSRINMLGISRHEQAVREAQERLDKLQQSVNIKFTAFDDHIGVEIGDVITVTHSYGISAQLFRVKKQPRLTKPGRVDIEAVWYAATDYDDTETAAPSYGDSDARIGEDFSLQQLISGAPNLLRNPTGFDGLNGWTGSGGSFGFISQASSNTKAPYFYLNNTGAAATYIRSSDFIPIGEGDNVYLSAEIYSGGLTVGAFYCDVIYYDGAFGWISEGPQIGTSTAHGWTYYSDNTAGLTPTGCEYMKVRVFLSSAVSSSTAIRNIKLEEGLYATPYTDPVVSDRSPISPENVSAFVNPLSVATDFVAENAITGHVISEETSDQTAIPVRPTGTTIPAFNVGTASVIHTLSSVVVAGTVDVMDVTFNVRLDMTNFYTSYSTGTVNNAIYFAIRRGATGPVIHSELLDVLTYAGFTAVRSDGSLFVPAITVIDDSVSAGTYTYYLYIQPIDMVYQHDTALAMITTITNSIGRAVVYKK
ncbi:MAG: phage tail protein [Candidatus Reddybacter sp.]